MCHMIGLRRTAAGRQHMLLLAAMTEFCTAVRPTRLAGVQVYSSKQQRPAAESRPRRAQF